MFDLYRYKVPNSLIVSNLIISLIWHLSQYPWDFISWIIGIIFPIVILFIFFKYRMIGASDCKIFSVLGGFLGIRPLISIMILSLFIGGILSVIKIFQRKNLKERYLTLVYFVKNEVGLKSSKKYYNLERDGDDGVIPFTIAISLATFIIF